MKKAGYNMTLIYKIFTPVIMVAFLPCVRDFIALKKAAAVENKETMGAFFLLILQSPADLLLYLIDQAWVTKPPRVAEEYSTRNIQQEL